MKCKECDGTGTSNWCINGTFKTCEACGGTGYVEFPMMSMNGDEYTGEWEQNECDACNGTGRVKKTNFDDITSSPERLAEFLRSVKCYCDYIHNCKKCPTGCKNGGWLGWLREEYHGRQ